MAIDLVGPTDDELTDLSLEEIVNAPEEYWDALIDAGPPCFCTDETCNNCLTEVPNEPTVEPDWDALLGEFFAQEFGEY